MAGEDHVVIANGIGEETGQLGCILQVDDLLRAAEVRLSLIAHQTTLGNERAGQVARHFEERHIALTHIATDAHANARLKVGYSVTDQICNGNVSFQSGNVTIKCNNIVFQGGTSVELGTELNVETR